MLFYTLAGFWKFGFGIAALITGDPGSFSFEALSWTIADRSLQTGTSPLLAEMIIFYPVIAWPAYIAVIYLQLFALLAVLRPRLTVFWGYALIGFHLGTWVLMEILFVEHVLLLVLLMALSPFAPERFRLAEFIRDLPILGRLTRIGAAIGDKGKTSLAEARR